MSTEKSIIYLAPSHSSFVIQDIEKLKMEIEVVPYFFIVQSKFLVPWLILKLFLFLIFSKKRDVLISFGGYHSFVGTLVARLKGSKSFIILNGTDSVSIPEFNYGHLRGGVLKFCCRKSYEWCSQLLPVSDSLLLTTNNYAFAEPRRLGVFNEFSDLKTKTKTIFNGFDTEYWQATTSKKPKSCITVATSNRQIHKGVDLILKLAEMNPDWTFEIAGIYHIDEAPDNVKTLGYLNKAQLREAYSASTYYLQLSIWEGFGCALCEAMLCGCMPLVSNVNILPEIVGDVGGVLSRRNVADLHSLLNQLAANEPIQHASRTRIETTFSLNKRIAELMKLIKEG